VYDPSLWGPLRISRIVDIIQYANLQKVFNVELLLKYLIPLHYDIDNVVTLFARCFFYCFIVIEWVYSAL